MIIQIALYLYATYESRDSVAICFLTTLKMNSIVGVVLHLSLLWTMQMISLILIYLVAGYIMSKPPGSKTLLDNAHLQLFGSMQAFNCIMATFGTLHYLDVDIPDPLPAIIGWFAYFCADFSIVSWIWAFTTNFIMVYSPSSMVDITDKTFIGVSVTITTLISGTTTVVAWSMGSCNVAYNAIADHDGNCSVVNVTRILLTTSAFVTTAGFKLFLAVTRSTLEEGENNILSTKALLTIIIPFAAIALTLSIFTENTLAFQLLAWTLYLPTVPFVVICFNENLRRFALKKITRFFNLENFVLQTREQQSLPKIQARFVAPDTIDLPNV